MGGNGNGDDNGSGKHGIDQALDAAAESSVAKVLTRFVMPVMLTVLGYMVIDKLNRFEAAQTKQGTDIVQIKSDMRDVNTRLDAQVIRTIDGNGKTIADHEKRLQALERAQRIP